MKRLAASLRKMQNGPVAKAILPDILGLAEREGILRAAEAHSPFLKAELCRRLESELGYDLSAGNRGRMIGVLLDILAECGRLRRDGERFAWVGGEPAVPVPPRTGETDGTECDREYGFFRECLRSAPAYLRGGRPFALFDEGSAATWERFLGCAEYNTCRSVLLDMMAIVDKPSFRLLDLCYGPGWGVLAAATRYPSIGTTALDFTDAFAARARERVETADAKNRAPGRACATRDWIGPDRWKGFGDPLPFEDGAFHGVLFSCGDPYIPPALRRSVYAEIRRVLVPGGRIGILTRGYPDPAARHVPSFWIRVAALAHDFAESVCEGWQGFSDVDDSNRLFADLGFRGSSPLFGGMSFLESCLWVLARD